MQQKKKAIPNASLEDRLDIAAVTTSSILLQEIGFCQCPSITRINVVCSISDRED